MLSIYCDQFDFSRLCKAFDGEVKADCGLSAEIIFTDKPEIRRLNRETRDKDDVTDVLSYPSLDDIRGVTLEKADFPADLDEDGNIFLGSIAICTDRAREQAEEYGHSYERELYYLAVHGLLHLAGYDHMTEEDKAQMREREERVLSKLDLKR